MFVLGAIGGAKSVFEGDLVVSGLAFGGNWLALAASVGLGADANKRSLTCGAFPPLLPPNPGISIGSTCHFSGTPEL